MKNSKLIAQRGLNTKFNASQVKFKKTFAAAKAKGVDLRNTTEMFKKDGIIWAISFDAYKSITGHYTERFALHPFIILKK